MKPQLSFPVVLICAVMLFTAQVHAQTPADSSWDSRFGYPGVVGQVNAIASIGSKVYVAGSFTVAGHTLANNIAMWDGSDWHTLGDGPANGVDSGVAGLQVIGTDLLVAGSFVTWGGLLSRGIARWDGHAWSAFGQSDTSNFPGKIFRMTTLNGAVVCAGPSQFRDSAGGFTIGRWNGAKWVRAAASNPSSISALTSFNGALYYAAYAIDTAFRSIPAVFKDSGGVTTLLGDLSTSPSTLGLLVDSIGIYAAGKPYLSKLEGDHWQVLLNYPSWYGNSLLRIGTRLLVGGGTGVKDSTHMHGLAMWDGTHGRPFDSTVQIHNILALARSPYGILAGGVSVNIVTDTTNTLLECPECNGLSFDAYNAAYFKGHLYAATRDNHFLRFDGAKSVTLDSVLPGQIGLVVATTNGLYVSSQQTTTSKRPLTTVTKWDGANWTQLDTISGSLPWCMAVGDHDEIYLVWGPNSPPFDSAYVTVIKNHQASALLGGRYPFTVGSEYAGVFVVDKHVLVAGQSFYGRNATTMISWDGVQWSGMDSSVRIYEKRQVAGKHKLYSNAYGVFNSDSGKMVTTNRMYAFDGQKWSPLFPSDSTLREWTVGEDGNDLYIAAEFGSMAGGTLHGIARYDGTKLNPLGSGCNGGTHIIVTDSEVWVLGSTSAGGRASVGLARWRKPYVSSVRVMESGEHTPLSIYPNPTSSTVHLKLGDAHHDISRVTVVDVTGRVVRTLYEGHGQGPSSEVTFEASSLTTGTYFCRTEGKGGVQVAPFTILR